MSKIGLLFSSMGLPKTFMQLGYYPKGFSPSMSDLIAGWGTVAYGLNLTPQEAVFLFVEHYVNELPERDPEDDIIIEGTLLSWKSSGKIDDHKLMASRGAMNKFQEVFDKGI